MPKYFDIQPVRPQKPTKPAPKTAKVAPKKAASTFWEVSPLLPLLLLFVLPAFHYQYLWLLILAIVLHFVVRRLTVKNEVLVPILTTLQFIFSITAAALLLQFFFPEAPLILLTLTLLLLIFFFRNYLVSPLKSSFFYLFVLACFLNLWLSGWTLPHLSDLFSPHLSPFFAIALLGSLIPLPSKEPASPYPLFWLLAFFFLTYVQGGSFHSLLGDLENLIPLLLLGLALQTAFRQTSAPTALSKRVFWPIVLIASILIAWLAPSLFTLASGIGALSVLLFLLLFLPIPKDFRYFRLQSPKP